MGSTSVKDVACALISTVGIATSLSVATMIFRSLRPSLYRQGLSCNLSDYRNCLRLHGIAKSEFRKRELAGSGGAKGRPALLNFWNLTNKCVIYKRTIKVCNHVVPDSVLGVLYA